MDGRWSQVPVLVWVFGGLLLLAGGRYAQLWLRRRDNQAIERSSIRGLRLLYDGLATFAKFNSGALPATLAGDDWAFAREYTFRAPPRWRFDERLVLAYDREPQHRLIDFPALRPGRAVLLGTGKVVVVSQPQFHQLMNADNRLRETLGLEPLGFGTES